MDRLSPLEETQKLKDLLMDALDFCESHRVEEEQLRKNLAPVLAIFGVKVWGSNSFALEGLLVDVQGLKAEAERLKTESSQAKFQFDQINRALTLAISSKDGLASALEECREELAKAQEMASENFNLGMQYRRNLDRAMETVETLEQEVQHYALRFCDLQDRLIAIESGKEEEPPCPSVSGIPYPSDTFHQVFALRAWGRKGWNVAGGLRLDLEKARIERDKSTVLADNRMSEIIHLKVELTAKTRAENFAAYGRGRLAGFKEAMDQTSPEWENRLAKERQKGQSEELERVIKILRNWRPIWLNEANWEAKVRGWISDTSAPQETESNG